MKCPKKSFRRRASIEWQRQSTVIDDMGVVVPTDALYEDTFFFPGAPNLLSSDFFLRGTACRASRFHKIILIKN
jgi:hypothetical protein